MGTLKIYQDCFGVRENRSDNYVDDNKIELAKFSILAGISFPSPLPSPLRTMVIYFPFHWILFYFLKNFPSFTARDRWQANESWMHISVLWHSLRMTFCQPWPSELTGVSRWLHMLTQARPLLGLGLAEGKSSEYALEAYLYDNNKSIMFSKRYRQVKSDLYAATNPILLAFSLSILMPSVTSF